MHHMRLCVQDRGFHRKKCRIGPSVTSGSPLPCHVILNFPPLCSSLCCWRVQWKMPESVEQTPLFLPDRGARVFWAGGLVSYVEATVDLVLMDQRFHCLVFLEPLSHSISSVSDLSIKALGVSNREAPHWKGLCEISSPVQLLSSHEEEGQRWMTDRERKSRSWTAIAMETFDLQACVQQERKRSKGMIVFFALIAQSGFSNVLLWNRNIEGIDQLSCTPGLCDIAGVLCNKGRKWKLTDKQFSCD